MEIEWNESTIPMRCIVFIYALCLYVHAYVIGIGMYEKFVGGRSYVLSVLYIELKATYTFTLKVLRWKRFSSQFFSSLVSSALWLSLFLATGCYILIRFKCKFYILKWSEARNDALCIVSCISKRWWDTRQFQCKTIKIETPLLYVQQEAPSALPAIIYL
jgi:hypothetical protein